MTIQPLCDILPTRKADVAQQVEQLIRNEQVSGSSPLVGSLNPLVIRNTDIQGPDEIGSFLRGVLLGRRASGRFIHVWVWLLAVMCKT